MHENDVELEDDYLDWFFLHYFGQVNLWRYLPEDKLVSIITLEQLKEQEYWETWGKMLRAK